MPSPLYVFASGNNATGNELWVAGAGLEAPRLLKDINPGANGSSPSQFTPLPDGRLLFVANDGLHGRELWVTDGTEAGTQMLRDIGTGDGTTGPEQLTLLPNGKVMFTANNGQSGRELWVTDGTANGTSLLKDINAGAEGSGISEIIALPNGRFIFTANDGVHGIELWTTDGTADGTHLLQDVTPGNIGSYLYFAHIDNDGRAVFSVSADGDYEGDRSDVFGEWRTDGTREGTVKVSNIPPETSGLPVGIEGDLYVYKGFYDGPPDFIQALFVEDGISGERRILLDQTGSRGSPNDMWPVGKGLALFNQFEDLWVTDGTEAGTKVIGKGVLFGSMAENFSVLSNGKVLFNNISNWMEDRGYSTSDLWVTDGTEAGTIRLTDQLTTNPKALPPTATVLADGTIVFSAPSIDGLPGRVYKINLEQGTVERSDTLTSWSGQLEVGQILADGSEPEQPPVTEQPGAPRPAAYVFINSGPEGNELWFANEEFGERRLLKDINTTGKSSDPSQLTRMPDGKVLFVANDGVHGKELWITNGTAEGTKMVYDIGAGYEPTGPQNLTLLPNGLVVFTADNGKDGRELWVTDGTTNGTYLLKDIQAGAAGADAADFTLLPSGRVVFTANDGENGRELWSTDGTVVGTVMLTDATPGNYGTDVSLVRVDGQGNAYFHVSPELGAPYIEGASGEWKTDGTPEGTIKTPGAPTAQPLHAVGTEGNLWVYKGYYWAGGSDNNYLQAVYATDGTEEGTRIIRDHQASRGAPSDVFSLGNGLAIIPEVNELWATDGTAEGTRLISEGSLSGYPEQSFLVLGDGRALFSSKGAEGTSDLWMTDGTEAGTIQLAPQSSTNPKELPETASVLADGTILFSGKSFGGNPVATWKVDAGAGTIERLKDVNPWSGATEAVLVGSPLPEEPSTPLPETPPGTEPAVPQPNPSEPELPAPPSGKVGAYVFINAELGHGNELWISDSEFGERRLLKDINPGLRGSDPTELTRMADGRVAFVANDGIHGRELWMTDGTEAGTRMVRDVGTGDGTYGPTNLVATSDGRLFFTANDGIRGSELWVSDGTRAGTYMVSDGVSGPWSSEPNGVKELANGTFIFTAGTSHTSRNELWATDGTTDGTVLIRPVPRTELLNLQDVVLSVDGSKGLVAAGWGFVVTDGTAEGTSTVSMMPASDGYYAAGMEGEARWVFARYDDEGPLINEKSLWSTDGTLEGTFKLLSPSEQTIGGRFSGDTKMAELGNGLVIFQGTSDLYVTDGTQEGTKVIGDDILGLHVQTDFVSLGDGRALFMNRDFGDTLQQPIKADLWVTDGSEQGTFRISGSHSWNAGSLPDEVSVLEDGSVVFSAASMDGNPNAVWKVNMYAGGLQRLDGMQNWAGDHQPTQVVALGAEDIFGLG